MDSLRYRDHWEGFGMVSLISQLSFSLKQTRVPFVVPWVTNCVLSLVLGKEMHEALENIWSLKLDNFSLESSIKLLLLTFHVHHFLYTTSLNPHIWPIRQQLVVPLYIRRNKEISKLAIVHTANKQRYQDEILGVTPFLNCFQLCDMVCLSFFLWFFLNRVSKSMVYSSMDLWASYKVLLFQIFCQPACLPWRIKVSRELWKSLWLLC